jgi:4-amino-4-deoxy-L-arabinose transferase-like glycosyltransferase
VKDRVAVILTTLTAVCHLALANRYDIFRDELYFIVCGRHPQFGYADQPPLIPLLDAGLYGLGGQTWILRLPDVIVAAALVWLVVAFVRTLGGGDRAAWIGGIVAALAPMLMGLTATMHTTVFEPLAWTFVAYALVRALVHDDRRILIWAGVAAGVAMEAKYAIPVWLLGLVVGLALTPERRVLRARELWLGVALAVVIALPSVLWQAANGFPFAALVHAAAEKNADVPPIAFALNQVFVFNPLFAPVWVAGLVAPFLSRELARLRFIPIAFAIVAIAIYAGHGKDYYLAPAYPSLIAVGAVALGRAIRSNAVTLGYGALAVALSLIVAPLALPILPIDDVVPYMQALHLAPQAQEKGAAGTPLPQSFADQFGWHDFVREVAAAYDKIPASQRAQTAILVDNYGEAGAIEIYGPAYGLPPPLSGHNQYGLWGMRGQHPRNVLRVHRDIEGVEAHCDRSVVLGTTFAKYDMQYENGKAILYCPNVHPPLETLFPSFRFLI